MAFRGRLLANLLANDNEEQLNLGAYGQYRQHASERTKAIQFSDAMHMDLDTIFVGAISDGEKCVLNRHGSWLLQFAPQN